MLDGEKMYISNSRNGTIYKTNLNEKPLTLSEIASGFDKPYNILFKNRQLYVSDFDNGRVLKIDLTAENFGQIDLLAEIGRPRGLAIHGENLYISGFADKALFKLNLSILDAEPEIVASNLNAITALAIKDNELYIAADGSIFKMPLEVLSSVEEIKNEPISIQVSPNPTTNFIKIDGIDKSQIYTLLNTQGSLVLNGTISPNQQLDLGHLIQGIYILRLENGSIHKIVKH